MRIIGGKMGGRRIRPPSKMPHTRPTTDVAKEGLFNILENNHQLEGLKTLDLFGGTGSITYELISRGATDCTVVEKDNAMARFIRDNVHSLQVEGKVRVVQTDVFRFIRQCGETFDFIFAGPPYALPEIDSLPALIFEKGLLVKNGWFVLEHTPQHDFSTVPSFVQQRNYGTTVFSIFINKEVSQP